MQYDSFRPGEKPPTYEFTSIRDGEQSVSPYERDDPYATNHFAPSPQNQYPDTQYDSSFYPPQQGQAYAVQHHSDPYGQHGDPYSSQAAAAPLPWWNPKGWTKKIWAGVVAVIVIIIVIVVAVAVTESQKNSYPAYEELNYSLSETYSGEDFFDQFNYFTGYDPTGGFVHYVPQAQAETLNLTYASSSSAVVRVDTSVGPNSDPNASTGRFSVRIESKTTYNSGLFIFDVRHTPYGCGTWPALWLTDPSNWPSHGEIDIMEAVNKGVDGNQMTLHTSSGCSMDVKRKMTGTAEKDDCDHSKNDNAGCGVTGKTDSFGAAMNDKDGSIMAVEWRDDGIRMWQFLGDSAPDDIANKNPQPDTWGTALADFPNTDCGIGSHFKNQSIVVNIDLCGDLVYQSWDDSGCSSNCTDLVANSPDAFTDAYWEFGSFQIYQAK